MVNVDAGLKRAYAALIAVRDSCCHASGELMGSGKRSAKLVVETLEAGYNDVLATKETLEGKAQASMRLMESFLSDLETRYIRSLRLGSGSR
jgi:adiponectin receptor